MTWWWFLLTSSFEIQICMYDIYGGADIFTSSLTHRTYIVWNALHTFLHVAPFHTYHFTFSIELIIKELEHWLLDNEVNWENLFFKHTSGKIMGFRYMSCEIHCTWDSRYIRYKFIHDIEHTKYKERKIPDTRHTRYTRYKVRKIPIHEIRV